MKPLITIVLLLLCSMRMTVSAQDVALVLSGGGARCIAQVGVLKVLEREGLIPDVIVGSSFGSIVGGLYAAGYSALEIEAMFRHVDWDELVALGETSNREFQYLSQKFEDDRSIITVRFNDFVFMPPTAIGGNTRFSFLLQKVLWESPFNTAVSFDSLSPRLRVIATNLATGRPEMLSAGNLATAIRASATFPLRYSPVRWNDSTVLVDGGLVSNIPTEAARELGAKMIILVNTISKLSSLENVRSPWAVADQSLTAAMMLRDSSRMALADVIIEPELSSWPTFDFRSIDSLIAIGEQAALASLPQIRALVGTAFKQPTIDAQSVDVFTTDNDTLLASKLIKELRKNTTTFSSRTLRVRIHKILHQFGYQFAFVRSVISDGAKRLWVTVDKGLVSHRTFEHVGGASAVRIAREAAFPDSANITIASLERAWNNLHAVDAIAESDIHIAETTPEGTSVRVSAIGNGNQAIRFGARVDNERYTQGSMEIAHDDIFTPGLRLSVIGTLSERIGSIAAGFEIPRIYGSLWTTTLRGYSSFRNVWLYNTTSEKPERLIRSGEYSEDRFGMRLSAGRALERNGIVLAELRYEMQRYRDLSSTTRPRYQPLATIRGVARWDDRDNISYPTKGRTIDLSAETSVLSLSNDLSFTKLSASLSSVFQWSWFTFTPSVLLGAADKTLPPSELFSLGGQDLFFGMREDQRRGRQIVVGNADLRAKLPFRIFFDTYVSFRYDFGAVWEIPEYIRIADLNHGAGLTIGVDTPIGPVKISAGRSFAFTSQPARLKMGPTLVYFAVGVRL